MLWARSFSVGGGVARAPKAVEQPQAAASAGRWPRSGTNALHEFLRRTERHGPATPTTPATGATVNALASYSSPGLDQERQHHAPKALILPIVPLHVGWRSLSPVIDEWPRAAQQL